MKSVHICTFFQIPARCCVLQTPSDHRDRHSPFTGFYTSGGLLVISGAASQFKQLDFTFQSSSIANCRLNVAMFISLRVVVSLHVSHILLSRSS